MAVTIHPTAVIYPGVLLGADVWIGPYVVIGSPAEIRGEWVGEGEVTVGDRTVIREFSCIQGPADIGEDCYLMDKTHVAHHCIVEHRATLSVGVHLAGYVTVEEDANIGMGVTVHQRLTIGAGSMVGMGSVVTKDVPAGRKWYGVPAQDRGPNDPRH